MSQSCAVHLIKRQEKQNLHINNFCRSWWCRCSQRCRYNTTSSHSRPRQQNTTIPHIFCEVKDISLSAGCSYERKIIAPSMNNRIKRTGETKPQFIEFKEFLIEETGFLQKKRSNTQLTKNLRRISCILDVYSKRVVQNWNGLSFLSRTL